MRAPPSATHSAPAPKASPDGHAADGDGHDLVGLAVDPRHRPIERVRDPYRAAADGNRAGTAADVVLRRDPAAAGVDRSDGFLIDPRQAIGLHDAADPEGREPGEQEQRRSRERRDEASSRRRPGVARRRWGGERRAPDPERGSRPAAAAARPRLDADLLHQRGARRSIGLERFGLAAGAIQREHALCVQPLAQRMLGRERLELGDHGTVAAGGEVGLDGQLGRSQPQLLQPPDLGCGEWLVGDVGERISAPEGQRVPGALLLDQPCKADGIDVALAEPQLVTAPAGHDLRAVAVEHMPQVRDVELHHLRRAGWRLLAPKALCQTVGGDGATDLEREHREYGALLTGAERDGPAIESRLDRP